MTLVLAHAGHWLVSLLYVLPVVLLVGALAFQSWRDRRNGVADEEELWEDRDS